MSSDYRDLLHKRNTAKRRAGAMTQKAAEIVASGTDDPMRIYLADKLVERASRQSAVAGTFDTLMVTENMSRLIITGGAASWASVAFRIGRMAAASTAALDSARGKLRGFEGARPHG